MQFLQLLESILHAKLINFYISFILMFSFIAISPMDCTAFKYAEAWCFVLYNIKKIDFYIPETFKVRDKNLHNVYIKKYGCISGMVFKQAQACPRT